MVVVDHEIMKPLILNTLTLTLTLTLTQQSTDTLHRGQSVLCCKYRAKHSGWNAWEQGSLRAPEIMQMQQVG